MLPWIIILEIVIKYFFLAKSRRVSGFVIDFKRRRVDHPRSAVRNFDKNGVSQIVGMMISGHKTASVYMRYRIVPENDIREALQKVEEAIKEQKQKTNVISMTGRKGR